MIQPAPVEMPANHRNGAVRQGSLRETIRQAEHNARQRVATVAVVDICRQCGVVSGVRAFCHGPTHKRRVLVGKRCRGAEPAKDVTLQRQKTKWSRWRK